MLTLLVALGHDVVFNIPCRTSGPAPATGTGGSEAQAGAPEAATDRRVSQAT